MCVCEMLLQKSITFFYKRERERESAIFHRATIKQRLKMLQKCWLCFRFKMIGSRMSPTDQSQSRS